MGRCEQMDLENELLDSLAALRTVAAWGIRERDAKRVGDIIELSASSDLLPPDLRMLWDAFGQVELTDLADASLLDVTLNDLVDRLFARVDERQRTIYRRRVADGATLARVGEELGVSRERIRQLQVKTERQIEAALQNDRLRPLHWRAADLRTSLGIAAPVTHDVTRLAVNRALRGASDESTGVLRPLILRLAGPFKERSGWLLLENTEAPDPSGIGALANESGLIGVADAHDWLAVHGVRAEFHDAWLQDFGAFRRDGDHLMVWSGNVVDKCVAVLKARAEPMSADDLVAVVSEGHNVNGVRGRLFDDARLIRVNRTEWALREWGLEEYTGITDEIAQRIEEAGGTVSVSVVVQDIVSQFRVKENSVLAYLAAPMFVTEGEHVRLRRNDEPFEVNASFERCTGAFHSSIGCVSLLIPVDAELLRGSGRPMSAPVAAAVGVSPGTPRSFSHADGELTVSWPVTSAAGPTLGSARVIAARAGASQGDGVRLDFHSEQGLVRAERVPYEVASLDTIEAIRLLTGMTVESGSELTSVARAVGIEPADVRKVLVARGDSELASLLPMALPDPGLESTLLDLAKTISRP